MIQVDENAIQGLIDSLGFGFQPSSRKRTRRTMDYRMTDDPAIRSVIEQHYPVDTDETPELPVPSPATLPQRAVPTSIGGIAITPVDKYVPASLSETPVGYRDSTRGLIRRMPMTREEWRNYEGSVGNPISPSPQVETADARLPKVATLGGYDRTGQGDIPYSTTGTSSMLPDEGIERIVSTPPPMPSRGLMRPQTEAPTDMAYRKLQQNQDRMTRTQAGEAYAELDAQGRPIKPREKNFWKRLGKGMINAYKEWEGGPDGGGLLGLVVHMLGGGIGSAASPQAHHVSELKNKQRGLMRDLALAQAQEQYTLGTKYKNAQIDNFYEDNRRQKEVAEDLASNRREILRLRKLDSFYERNPFFNSAMATDAQKRQLAEIGENPESVGSYDFSKREFKNVAGHTFKWDPNQKKFIDMELTDPAEETAEIVLTDPGTGQPITLKTTSSRKAQMLNSRVVAQMQADAARARQQSQQTFTAEQNDKNRAQARQIAAERIGIARENIRLAEQRLKLADAASRANAEDDVRKAKMAMIRLQAYLKNSSLIGADDPIWQEFNELEQ